MNGMQENKRAPIIALNHDHPVRCIIAMTFSGNDRSAKTPIISPNVEPRSPVTKEKNAPTRFGLRGGTGSGTDAGRAVGVAPVGVGALEPRGGCRGVAGLGDGAVPI